MKLENKDDQDKEIISEKKNEIVIKDSTKWKGKNFFYIFNFLITGPSNIKPLLMTISFLILIPLLCILLVEWEWYQTKNKKAILAFYIIINLVLVFLIFSTTFSNPGILPRIIFRTKNDDISNPHKVKIKIVQNGIIKNYKSCETCKIIKPQRSNHCHDCNNCVEKFDHHCPWIGQCVAARNYRKFFMFVIVANINAIYIVGISIAKYDYEIRHYKVHSLRPSQLALSENSCTIFLIIYNLIALLFLLSLLLYHCHLVYNNMTTRENLKNMFPKPFENIYDNSVNFGCFKGKILNFFNVLICPRYVSTKTNFIIKYEKSIKIDKTKLRKPTNDNEENIRLKIKKDEKDDDRSVAASNVDLLFKAPKNKLKDSKNDSVNSININTESKISKINTLDHNIGKHYFNTSKVHNEYNDNMNYVSNFKEVLRKNSSTSKKFDKSPQNENEQNDYGMNSKNNSTYDYDKSDMRINEDRTLSIKNKLKIEPTKLHFKDHI